MKTFLPLLLLYSTLSYSMQNSIKLCHKIPGIANKHVAFDPHTPNRIAYINEDRRGEGDEQIHLYDIETRKDIYPDWYYDKHSKLLFDPYNTHQIYLMTSTRKYPSVKNTVALWDYENNTINEKGYNTTAPEIHHELSPCIPNTLYYNTTNKQGIHVVTVDSESTDPERLTVIEDTTILFKNKKCALFTLTNEGKDIVLASGLGIAGLYSLETQQYKRKIKTRGMQATKKIAQSPTTLMEVCLLGNHGVALNDMRIPNETKFISFLDGGLQNCVFSSQKPHILAILATKALHLFDTRNINVPLESKKIRNHIDTLVADPFNHRFATLTTQKRDHCRREIGHTVQLWEPSA